MPPLAISVGSVSVHPHVIICEICEASIMGIFHIWEIRKASIPHVLKADGKTSVMILIKTRGVNSALSEKKKKRKNALCSTIPFLDSIKLL